MEKIFNGDVLEISNLAAVLGKEAVERTLPNGRVVSQIVWDGADLAEIARLLHNHSGEMPEVVHINGAAPAWLVAALSHECHPRQVALNSPDGYVPVGCARPDGEGHGMRIYGVEIPMNIFKNQEMIKDEKQISLFQECDFYKDLDKDIKMLSLEHKYYTPGYHLILTKCSLDGPEVYLYDDAGLSKLTAINDYLTFSDIETNSLQNLNISIIHNQTFFKEFLPSLLNDLTEDVIGEAHA